MIQSTCRTSQLQQSGAQLGEGLFQNRMQVLHGWPEVNLSPSLMQDFFQLGWPAPLGKDWRSVTGKIKVDQFSVILGCQLVVGFLERQNLVDQQAHRVDLTAKIVGFSAGNLGSHVAGRTHLGRQVEQSISNWRLFHFSEIAIDAGWNANFGFGRVGTLSAVPFASLAVRRIFSPKGRRGTVWRHASPTAAAGEEGFGIETGNATGTGGTSSL